MSSVRSRTTVQISPGKFNRLHRIPAGSTSLVFDGYGLRDSSPARPTKAASYPISVRQVAALIHAAFRHHLAGMPLRFTNPSPPSGWIRDFHPRAAEHAGHTTKPLRGKNSEVVASPIISLRIHCRVRSREEYPSEHSTTAKPRAFSYKR